VGPICILCVRTTLLYGFIKGFACGMGAAVANIVFASIAGFGLASISHFLVHNQEYIKIGGSIYLFYVGITFLLSKKSMNDHTHHEPVNHLGRSFMTTFFLTLTNPMAILMFIALFAKLHVSAGGMSYVYALSLVGGIFIGSVIWWVGFLGIIAVVERYFMTSFFTGLIRSPEQRLSGLGCIF